ncbi:glycine receptor subunit alpha-2-like [Glandiceps talaboti]
MIVQYLTRVTFSAAVLLLSIHLQRLQAKEIGHEESTEGYGRGYNVSSRENVEDGEESEHHEKHNSTTTTEFVTKLMENYDRRIRPDFDGPSTDVRVDLFISRLDSVAELTMDYGATVILRQMWNDPRLKYNANTQHIPPSAHLLNKIWIPDLYFTNEKSAHFHDQTIDNVMLRFYPSGDVLYSMRISLTLTCQMAFGRFPNDVQDCGILLESYGYTVDELNFVWKSEEPIQLPDSVQLQQFSLTRNETLNCTKSYYTGTFSCLEARFQFTRALGYYWLSYYIPTILLVILSWVSFWISPKAAPARVSLGTTIILTVTTQAISVHSSLPKVSYVTAMDIWMLACLVFVVASLVQYAVVNFMLTRSEDSGEKMKLSFHKNSQVGYSKGVTNKGGEVSFIDADMESQQRHQRGPEIAIRLDRISRVFFPIAFLLFNTVYWPYTGLAMAK